MSGARARLASFVAVTVVTLAACGGGDPSKRSDTASRQRNVALTNGTLSSLLTPRFFTSGYNSSLVITNDDELIMWGWFPVSYSPDWQLQYEENPTPPISHARAAALDDTMAVAIDLDNKFHAWGAGSSFGNYSEIPAGLDLSTVTSLFLNNGMIAAIDYAGKLWEWGPAAAWATGIPESVSRKKIKSYTSFNGQYSMAIDEDGKVSTWGNDAYAIVGRIRDRFADVSARSIYSTGYEAFVVTTDGDVLHVTDGQQPDLQLFDGVDVQQVVKTGMGTYVAIDTKGKLHLGDAGFTYGWQDRIDAWNQDNAGNYGDTFPTLSAGLRHVSILSDGYVWNLSNQGWIGYLTMPELFHSGQYVSPIAAGPYSTYAIDENFTINTFHSDQNLTQVTAPIGSNFMAVAAGWTHGLALRRNGTLVTWGDAPNNGALPDIEGRVTRIGAGFQLSAALDNYGNIFEWGEFFSPENNIKERPNDEDCVYYDNMDVGYNSIIATGNTCNGNNRLLHVWGDNTYGQADIPDDLDASEVYDIAASYDCMAAVVEENIRTWGACRGGQSEVPSGVKFRDVELGWGFAVGITTDDVPMVWGSLPRQELNPPAGLQGLASVSVGYEHIVATDWSGNVMSWGSNMHGESTVPNKFNPLPPFEDRKGDENSMYPTARDNSEAAAEAIANPVDSPTVVNDALLIVTRGGEQVDTTLPAPTVIAVPNAAPKAVKSQFTVALPAARNPMVGVGAVVNTSQATKRLGLTKVSGVTFVVPKPLTSASSKVCTITSKSVTVVSAGICDVKVTYRDAKKKKRARALTLISRP